MESMGLANYPYVSASFPTVTFGNKNKTTPSFARHGVHDLHGAHYLNLFEVLQDGMPRRLQIWRFSAAAPCESL